MIAAGFVGVLVCLVILGSLAENIRAQEALALDTLATPFLHRYASPNLDMTMTLVTTLGSDLWIGALMVVLLAGLTWRRRYREGLFLSVAVGGSVALNGLMKAVFQRPRPQLAWAQAPTDYSFPSGHSMIGIVFYLAVALLVWELRGYRAGIGATLGALMLALLIDLSRIYLGLHYFSDVAGGSLAGLLWLFVVVAGFAGGRRVRTRRGATPPGPLGGPDDRGGGATVQRSAPKPKLRSLPGGSESRRCQFKPSRGRVPRQGQRVLFVSARSDSVPVIASARRASRTNADPSAISGPG